MDINVNSCNSLLLDKTATNVIYDIGCNTIIGAKADNNPYFSIVSEIACSKVTYPIFSQRAVF